MSKFYCYILYSLSTNRFYVGHTGEIIEERVRKHNSNHKGYTGKAQDWEIAYLEMYKTKEAAYTRERTIKSWKSRLRIEALIAGT
jgi:putative endonuclease